jgi:hypothetical protein
MPIKILHIEKMEESAARLSKFKEMREGIKSAIFAALEAWKSYFDCGGKSHHVYTSLPRRQR